MTQRPDIYRLLSAFSGEPRSPYDALRASGLWWGEDSESLPPELRALLRQLSTEGRVRWVEWKQGEVVLRQGYVLTGCGEAALDVYLAAYGPVRPRLAEVALENRRADLLSTLHARLEALA
ncbi:hypothetical protein [Deinococcus wulumuqiensis]|uniref:Uncharacterized protein n=1 Tax=Deinococcus wulumuqiensis TaxID=980427 RepID=A0AAV4K436_9DEIO|nr:hypothetical protein [Deinococcus wulumuqiensis]QII20215.1 hypothetical protein G6R31_05095 [Deinococcus wulumuqiensis R12]GGI75107.1 hypothetical protein GCM10010914_06670 [Deinococcus wulumuqiensis]GGP28683.1 hypothetical protein GCM10008021_03340 [Deinococcus wulumuqiensis]